MLIRVRRLDLAELRDKVTELDTQIANMFAWAYRQSCGGTPRRLKNDKSLLKALKRLMTEDTLGIHSRWAQFEVFMLGQQKTLVC